MLEIVEQILKAGKSFRLGEPPFCTVQDLATFESELGAKLPEAYRQFVDLNGFDELNFEQELLTPQEIGKAMVFPGPGLIPFASNGCGDLYCWPVAELPEASVVFRDHETGQVLPRFGSFVEALSAWRRS